MYLLRKLIYIAGLAALLVSQPGYAMGLGESELKSALNQPLQADIELTNLRGLDENEIIVRLASNEDFERAGLERLEYYSQLRFEVMLDHESGPIVRVTTREPVREPYLNILVEARWASGRLLREYTFLLDLPTYDDDRRTQPVEAARADSGRDTASGSRRESPQQGARRDRAPEPEARRGTAGEGSNTYGPVGDSDTLWEIALQVRPGRDVSVQQTMLAIQRKNPEAFINGNINLLREGQVLRLPSRDEIQGQSQQQALREVADHNRQWSEQNSDRAMGAQLDAGRRGASAPSDAEEVSGQVRLATPNQSGSDDAGQGGGDSTDRGAELESDLASAQEELERTQRENTELSSRVEELEEQIETMESLIEASNEQLSALQTAARQSQDQPSEDAAQPESTGETEPEATEQAAVQDEPAETQAAAEETPAEAAEATEQASAEEDRSRRVVRSIPQSKTLVDHLLENILWIALAALVILAGVYYALRRRGQTDETQAEENTFDSDFEAENFADSQEDFQAVDDDAEGFDLAQEPDEEYDSADWAENEEPGLEAETGDVVGEADIYIAYGKLDQAEELLLNGLEKEPGSPQILSKLLEVNAENRDVEAFDKHYASLLATDDRAAIQRAGELRDTIPGAGEFDVSALGAGAFSGADEGETRDDRAEPSMDFSDLDDSASEDLDFSLDLDDDLEESDEFAAEGESDKRASQSDSSEEELSLDDDFSFDLEDDSELEADEKPLVDDDDLEGSSTSRYDLTFGDEDKTGESDDEFTLDFDLEEEDSSADASEPQAKESDEEFPELDLNLAGDDELSGAASDDKADDDWSFDFETSDSETADLDKLDEELSALDEEPSADQKPSAEQEPSTEQEPSAVDEEPSAVTKESRSETTTSDQDDDFSFDLEDSLGETAPAESGSETDKQDFAPELDEDFSLDFDDEEPSADREPSAGEESSAGEEPSAYEEPSAEEQPSADEEPSAAEKSTADSDAESDFDLDDMDMDDMDLSRLDQDMSELDADLEEPAIESASAEEQQPSAGTEEGEADDLSGSNSDEDDMFEEALSGFSEETAESEPAETGETHDERSEEDMDSELDFLADTDEAATKLDLARAYIDMGDADGARDILEEVSQEGNDEQKQEAAELLSRIEA
ncbi:FimV/HubP family polar landmark protein [Marinimicrobium sp. C2-29]|uniref:FimV/HubP family polar landmark protein n=1 Tax=Marinimicrobium sp. C2-29 TaxID=3139825 RepID=UPI00313A2C63